MFSPTTPAAQLLGDQLFLTSVASHKDIERLAEFNAQIHGPGIAPLTRSLILHHPDTRPEYWLFVEDRAAGRIVCSLALIPWTWRYDDVMLKAGEMAIVGTAEDYRRRGLVRALDRQFKTLLHEGEFDLSHIQGIPYFYRQFGYDYAIPLEGGWRLALDQIPGALGSGFQFRRATAGDLPHLMRLFDEAAAALDISATRSEAVWRYLLEHNPQTETAREYWIVEDADATLIGYWCIELRGFGEGLNVCETSTLSQAAGVALFPFLKQLAAERNKRYIRLNLPANTTLIDIARAWGGQDVGTYAWQIHIPDIPRLLRRLAPVFERRLAASPFAGLTQDVVLNLYRKAITLKFSEGKLIAVENSAPHQGSEIQIPPELIAPLALGYRSREELAQAHHDLSIWSQSRYLVDVLFPKARSFIYTIY